MSVLIKHMAMPKGCIYANDKDQTEYCPLLNHDDVPFCQYIETEPEIAIGIDERPVYCPLFDVSESCQDTVSRAAAVDALDEIESEIANGYGYQYPKWRKYFCELPSAQPERLTDDDFETIRIHLNAQKEKLCNQQRWEEAEEYQRIIDRFMAFASAEPEIIRCRDCKNHVLHPRIGVPWCKLLHSDMGDNQFCSYAERREVD